MSWNVDYSGLKSILPLEGNVISATYRDEPLEGGYAKPMRLCTAMGAARKGKIINLDEPDQTCVGGLYWCGFHSEPHPGMIDFMVHKRHRFANRLIAERDIIIPHRVPSRPFKYLIFAPLDKTPFEPDLVIFSCNPQQAHNLISTSIYDSGDLKSSIITGAVCRSAVTYPLLRGDLQIGLIDNGGRSHAGFKTWEMVVSMPTRVFLETVRNQEHKKKFPVAGESSANLLVKKIKKEGSV